MDKLRHALRYVVNGAALASAVVALPTFGAIVPAAVVVKIAGGVAVVNTILTWLRPITESK